MHDGEPVGCGSRSACSRARRRVTRARAPSRGDEREQPRRAPRRARGEHGAERADAADDPTTTRCRPRAPIPRRRCSSRNRATPCTRPTGDSRPCAVMGPVAPTTAPRVSPMSVHVQTDGPVTTVTLDRPEARNAVDRADRRRPWPTRSATSRPTTTPRSRCSPAPAAPSARGPTSRPSATDAGNRVAADGDAPMGPSRLRLTKPVIAAIEGYAVAGGLELALWADLRVAAEDAVLGVFCRRWGVPLIDGGTVRLPRLIGESRAMDLVLTGRAVPADGGAGDRPGQPALRAGTSAGDGPASWPRSWRASRRRACVRTGWACSSSGAWRRRRRWPRSSTRRAARWPRTRRRGRRPLRRRARAGTAPSRAATA